MEVLSQVDYPSFGFMAFNALEPATTNMWEIFSAPCEGNGMNSRNHHMFSAVSAPLVRLAGLERPARCRAGQCRAALRVASARGLASGHLTHSVGGSGRALVVDWQRHGGTQCAKAPLPAFASSSAALLTCGSEGGVIDEVVFASFGTPRGRCGSFAVTEVHDPESKSMVEAACLGEVSCLLGGGPESGGVGAGMKAGPHGLDVAWAAVEVRCAGGRTGVSMDLVVPEGLVVDVAIPADVVGRGKIVSVAAGGDAPTRRTRAETAKEVDRQGREFVRFEVRAGDYGGGSTRVAVRAW